VSGFVQITIANSGRQDALAHAEQATHNHLDKL
jgi:hypothetical protein